MSFFDPRKGGTGRHNSQHPDGKDYFGLIDTKNPFPPFVPDDPEKPHLTSRKKERERQAIILKVIREILRFKAEDGDYEAMKKQKSIFDNDDKSNMLWHKLAVNLLYSGKNNNIIKNYEETRRKSLRSMHSENIVNFNQSISSSSPKRKQSVLKPVSIVDAKS